MWEPTQQRDGEGRGRELLESDIYPSRSHRGKGDGMSAEEIERNTGNPSGGCVTQPDAREGQAGPCGVADRLVVPLRSGNADGGKGPDFGDVLEVTKSQESGHVAYYLRQRLGSRGRNYRVSEGPADMRTRGLTKEIRRRAGCGKFARPVR